MINLPMILVLLTEILRPAPDATLLEYTKRRNHYFLQNIFVAAILVPFS